MPAFTMPAQEESSTLVSNIAEAVLGPGSEGEDTSVEDSRSVQFLGEGGRRRKLHVWLALAAAGLVAVGVVTAGVATGRVSRPFEGAGTAEVFTGELDVLDEEKAPKKKWPFPSLFCFCVTATSGDELELVRMQIKKKVGIFKCDESMVLSHGGKAWLHDNMFAKPIHAPPEKMGNPNEPGVTTSSWLNTRTFMEAWKMVRKDYRFRAHDWTLKADPDAVVLPWRIRNLVRPYTVKKPHGTKRFFLNCNRQSPNGPVGDGKLYGSVEMYSTGALETFFWATSPGKNIDDCMKELPVDKWGEDLFMQRCMDMLVIKPVETYGWVADNRCIPGDCSDPSKAAHHDFKFTAKARGYDHSWEWCWDKAVKADKSQQ